MYHEIGCQVHGLHSSQVNNNYIKVVNVMDKETITKEHINEDVAFISVAIVQYSFNVGHSIHLLENDILGVM